MMQTSYGAVHLLWCYITRAAAKFSLSLPGTFPNGQDSKHWCLHMAHFNNNNKMLPACCSNELQYIFTLSKDIHPTTVGICLIAVIVGV